MCSLYRMKCVKVLDPPPDHSGDCEISHYDGKTKLNNGVSILDMGLMTKYFLWFSLSFKKKFQHNLDHWWNQYDIDTRVQNKKCKCPTN